MKMKKTLIALVAVPMMLGSMAAMAKGPHGQDGHHGGMRGGEQAIYKQLNLTDDQKEQMKELHKQLRSEAKEERKSHHEDAKADRQQMDQLIMAEKFDEDAVRKLAQKMADNKAEGQVKFAKARYEMMQILTPEQKAKFQELRQQQREKQMEKMKERVEKWEAEKADK